MSYLLAFLDRCLVGVAIIALLAILALTTISVLGRYVFNAPFPDDVVINEYLMVGVVFLPLAYVQRHRGHLFVAVFTDWLPATARIGLEILSLTIGIGIFGLWTAATFGDFLSAWQIGAYTEGQLELRQWPARLIVSVGLGVFTLRLLYDLGVAATRFRDGQT